jgi:hypothetical protein
MSHYSLNFSQPIKEYFFIYEPNLLLTEKNKIDLFQKIPYEIKKCSICNIKQKCFHLICNHFCCPQCFINNYNITKTCKLCSTIIGNKNTIFIIK